MPFAKSVIKRLANARNKRKRNTNVILVKQEQQLLHLIADVKFKRMIVVALPVLLPQAVYKLLNQKLRFMLTLTQFIQMQMRQLSVKAQILQQLMTTCLKHTMV